MYLEKGQNGGKVSVGKFRILFFYGTYHDRGVLEECCQWYSPNRWMIRNKKQDDSYAFSFQVLRMCVCVCVCVCEERESSREFERERCLVRCLCLLYSLDAEIGSLGLFRQNPRYTTESNNTNNFLSGISKCSSVGTYVPGLKGIFHLRVSCDTHKKPLTPLFSLSFYLYRKGYHLFFYDTCILSFAKSWQIRCGNGEETEVYVALLFSEFIYSSSYTQLYSCTL